MRATRAGGPPDNLGEGAPDNLSEGAPDNLGEGSPDNRLRYARGGTAPLQLQLLRWVWLVAMRYLPQTGVLVENAAHDCGHCDRNRWPELGLKGVPHAL